MVDKDKRWNEIKKIWRQNQWLYVFSGFLLGTLVSPMFQLMREDFYAFLTTLVPEGLGIAFTILIIQQVINNRDRKMLYDELVENLHSQEKNIVETSVRKLKALNWFYDKTFSGIDLNGANLAGQAIGKAEFEGTVLAFSRLQHVDLIRANLRYANLNFARLNNSVLWYADLSGASLIHANMKGADLSGADLSGAILLNAELHNVIWASDEEKYFDRNGEICMVIDTDTEIDYSVMRVAILPDGTNWNEDEDLARFTDKKHPKYIETFEAIIDCRKRRGIKLLFPTLLSLSH